MFRNGGILAYITSQGVLNSPKNEPIRRFLMQGNDLVSAIRLPNNLFSDYAGTQVGSDLVILQKNGAKQNMTELEELFCQSITTKNDIRSNALLEDRARIIHTDQKLSTDQYGKPAVIYLHKGGIEGIASDLQKLVADDTKRNLNMDLYNGLKNSKSIIIDLNVKAMKPSGESIPSLQISINSLKSSAVASEVKQLSIFDLFKD